MKYLHLILICLCFLPYKAHASSDGVETPPADAPEQRPVEYLFAEIEYEHDINTAADLLLNVRIHAGGAFPGITENPDFIETTVRCHIRVRGISVPQALETAESRRGRMLKEVQLERKRWDASIAYAWEIVKQFKQFRLSFPEQIAPGLVECDVEFHLGGAWHDLAVALVQDEHARVKLDNGNRWNWGSRMVRPHLILE